MLSQCRDVVDARGVYLSQRSSSTIVHEQVVGLNRASSIVLDASPSNLKLGFGRLNEIWRFQVHRSGANGEFKLCRVRACSVEVETSHFDGVSVTSLDVWAGQRVLQDVWVVLRVENQSKLVL